MDFTLKIICLVLVSAAMGQFETEAAEDPQEKSPPFHIEEHKETREFLKSEVERYFSSLWKKVTRSNSEMLSKLEILNGKLETLTEKIGKIERNPKELSSNFSKTLNETVDINLLDSLEQRLEGGSVSSQSVSYAYSENVDD